MIARIPGLTLALSIVMTTASAQETKQPQIHRGSVNIGLVYPISTAGLNAPRTSNYFSANAIAGISYDEYAFCVAGVTNVIRHDAYGLIAAGFSNHIFHEANGLQAAGFVNTVRKHTKGVQAAGFMNYSGSVKGAQLAGFVNITRGEIKGVQAAGFANLASDADVQLSGFFNRTYNTSTQIAGFVNVAHNVRGVQVAGFINIADSSDYPIGLINIVRNGEKNIGITMDESMTTMVSFRSGGKKLYGIVGIGANLQDRPGTLFGDGDWPFYALEGGLGAHLPLYKSLRLNVEGVATSISDFYVGYYLRTSLRVLPSITIGKHTEIFAGPTFNVENTNISAGPRGVSTNYLWGTNLWNSLNSLYIGAVGGIAYKF